MASYGTYKDFYLTVRNKKELGTHDKSSYTPNNFRVCARRKCLEKCFKTCYIFGIRKPQIVFSTLDFESTFQVKLSIWTSEIREFS